MSAWKGKYFEVMVRDRLNAGEWVGDIYLEPGQTAELAMSATQPGWDLRIIDANGNTNELLQLKSTDSLGYVKTALERYPGIDVVATDEVLNNGGAVLDRIHASNLSDADLEKAVRVPMEELLDSPLEEIAETILPGLPFLIIAVGETRKFFVGKKSYEQALASFTERGVKTGISMGVGYIVWLLDGGWLSIPATLLTRLCIDKVKILRLTEQRLKNWSNKLFALRKQYKFQ